MFDKLKRCKKLELKWQVRDKGVHSSYHHGKAVPLLVDDSQTMHSPPATKIHQGTHKFYIYWDVSRTHTHICRRQKVDLVIPIKHEIAELMLHLTWETNGKRKTKPLSWRLFCYWVDMFCRIRWSWHSKVKTWLELIHSRVQTKPTAMVAMMNKNAGFNNEFRHTCTSSVGRDFEVFDCILKGLRSTSTWERKSSQ